MSTPWPSAVPADHHPSRRPSWPSGTNLGSLPSPRLRVTSRQPRPREAAPRGLSSAHERRNRAFWDADADDYQAAQAADLRSDRARAWGVWRIPESEVQALGPIQGLDILEYGCGAAQWSIALASDGPRPV